MKNANRINVSFAFSPAFAKKLRVAISASDSTASEYVEKHLQKIVQADLKSLIEELS